MLTATGVSADIAAWALAFTKEARVFLLLTNFADALPRLLLGATAAITSCCRVQLGVDPNHFGLAMVPKLLIGLPSADGDGAVRAGARRRPLVRARDDGDPAMAGATARQPGNPTCRASCCSYRRFFRLGLELS